MENGIYCLWAVATSLIAYWTTRLVIWINICDMPNARSSHVSPTPKAGGFSIFVPFAAGLAFYLVFVESSPSMWAIFAGGCGMALMGLWDDVKGLSWKTRLFIQFLMASLVVYTGLYIQGIWLPHFGYLSFGSAAPFLSMLGIVTFTNLYNFMDGLNGLSMGCTLIGLAFFGFFLFLHPGVIDQQDFLTIIVITLWASLAILFFFNFPNARVFLGDTGSQFLGFIIIVLGFSFSLSGSRAMEALHMGADLSDFLTIYTPFLMPFLFFSFLFDGCVTVIRRLLLGVPIWEADRGHVFHRYLEKTSSIFVVYVHYMLFVVSGIIVWFFLRFPGRFFILAFLPLLIIHGLYLAYVMVKK